MNFYVYFIYEEESVNRSRKTCDIRTWKKCISRHIHHQHWYTCPISLPVRRNPKHRSLLTIISTTSAPQFQPLRHQRNVCHQGGFIADQTDATGTPNHKQDTFIYECPLHWVFLPTKKLTTERCSLVVHSSTVEISTAQTSSWTCACSSATETVMKLDCAAT
jgi:hypothetical protein